MDKIPPKQISLLLHSVVFELLTSVGKVDIKVIFAIAVIAVLTEKSGQTKSRSNPNGPKPSHNHNHKHNRNHNPNHNFNPTPNPNSTSNAVFCRYASFVWTLMPSARRQLIFLIKEYMFIKIWFCGLNL